MDAEEPGGLSHALTGARSRQQQVENPSQHQAVTAPSHTQIKLVGREFDLWFYKTRFFFSFWGQMHNWRKILTCLSKRPVLVFINIYWY